MLHTRDDLNENALKSNKLHLCEQVDNDRLALESYDYMLNYLKKRGLSCKIFSCNYCGDDSESLYHYKLEFVLSEYVKEFEKTYLCFEKNELICEIFCDNEKSRVKTNVFHFLCARKWEEDVKAEMKALYPNYHVNINYNVMNMYQKVPNSIFCKKDTYDYEAYLEYLYKHNKTVVIGNSINVILPTNAIKMDTDKLYEAMKPFIKKYYIKHVHFVKPVDKAAMFKIKAEERLLENFYTNKEKKDGVSWVMSYHVYNDNKYKFDKKQEIYVENKVKKYLDTAKKYLSVILAIVFFPITIIVIISYIVYMHIVIKVIGKMG